MLRAAAYRCAHLNGNPRGGYGRSLAKEVAEMDIHLADRFDETAVGKRPCLDGLEADRFGQRGDDIFGVRIVACDKHLQRLSPASFGRQ